MGTLYLNIKKFGFESIHMAEFAWPLWNRKKVSSNVLPRQEDGFIQPAK